MKGRRNRYCSSVEILIIFYCCHFGMIVGVHTCGIAHLPLTIYKIVINLPFPQIQDCSWPQQKYNCLIISARKNSCFTNIQHIASLHQHSTLFQNQQYTTSPMTPDIIRAHMNAVHTKLTEECRTSRFLIALTIYYSWITLNNFTHHPKWLSNQVRLGSTTGFMISFMLMKWFYVQ